MCVINWTVLYFVIFDREKVSNIYLVEVFYMEMYIIVNILRLSVKYATINERKLKFYEKFKLTSD